MFTDAARRNASCPADKPRARFADAGGLYLEVAASGSKRWFVKYRFGGKEKRLALGNYPLVSLKEAREGRDKAKKAQRSKPAGCPRCWRRVGVLFQRGAAGSICRRCGSVAYRSQSEDECGQSLRKQHKAEARLGEGWRWPKGMHKATRANLLALIRECEERRDDALAACVAKHFPGGLGT